MTQVRNCQICKIYVCNDDICGECKSEIAHRSILGQSFDRKDIKKAVLKARDERHRRESLEMLNNLTEQDGRNDWRKYLRERNSAYNVIDEAFEFMSKCVSDKKEIDWMDLSNILTKVDTGRETQNKFEKAKVILRENFNKKE